jgi:hypothetical protein
MLEAKETKFFPYIKKTKKIEDGDVVYTEEQVITERVVDDNHTQIDALKTAMKSKGMLSDKSTREVDQIDRLIELGLAQLAAAGQTPDAGENPKADKPDQAAS